MILQGANRIDVRIYTHAARKKAVSTAEFAKWRQFFAEEIQGDQISMFQPDKLSPDFLKYLEALCKGPVYLSKTLYASLPDDRSFDAILSDLYVRLVLPPENAVAESPNRPTGLFRKLSVEHRFVERGLKRHSHVVIEQKPLWVAYRQVLNGELIAIDKVEVANQIGATSNEIERLPTIAHNLRNFVGKKVDGKETRYVLLADRMVEPFSTQSGEEFKLMMDDLEEAVASIAKQGGAVMRTTNEVEKFASDLNRRLPG